MQYSHGFVDLHYVIVDTQELKKMLKGSTAVLILDNGEPSYVILGYDAYKGLLSDQEKEIKINHRPRQETSSPDSAGDDQRFQHRISEKESEFLEKINKQILSIKDEIDKEEKIATNPHVD